MSSPDNISVDIETLDTTPTAKILSIGAVWFNVHTNMARSFYAEINPSTQPLRTESQATLDWWAQQSIPMPGISSENSLFEVLRDFKTWLLKLGDLNDRRIWCKGTDFDLPCLTSAFADCGLAVPWKYNAGRDLRTLLALYPKTKLSDRLPHEVTHNALGDAQYQARQIRSTLTSARIYWEYL
jgi:hypothetical protein